MPRSMLTVAPGGSNQYAWKLPNLLTTTGQPNGEPTLLTNTSALGAVGLYAHLIGFPALSTAVAHIHAVDPTNSIMFRWFGTGADNDTFTARLWGVRDMEASFSVAGLKKEQMGDHLLDLTLTLSGALVNVSSTIITQTMLAPSSATVIGRWADTIAATSDDSLDPPAMRSFSNDANSAVVCIIDSVGYSGFIVQCQAAGTTARMGFLYAEV